MAYNFAKTVDLHCALCIMHYGKVFQVTLGCVNGSPDIEIGQHIFVGSKANWEVIPEGVLQFHEGQE